MYDGDIIEKGGRRFRINIEADDDMGPPWLVHDGHGVVTQWTSCSKRPNYLILSTDRSLHRYYDVTASISIATKDGWGLGVEEKAKLAAHLGREPTHKEIIATAVNNDFEYLRRWCNDQWWWVGVVVTDITDNERAKTDYTHALWGIESDAGEYLDEVAMESVDDFLYLINKEQSEAHYWACRDVPTDQAWAP